MSFWEVSKLTTGTSEDLPRLAALLLPHIHAAVAQAELPEPGAAQLLKTIQGEAIELEHRDRGGAELIASDFVQYQVGLRFDIGFAIWTLSCKNNNTLTKSKNARRTSWRILKMRDMIKYDHCTQVQVRLCGFYWCRLHVATSLLGFLPLLGLTDLTLRRMSLWPGWNSFTNPPTWVCLLAK